MARHVQPGLVQAEGLDVAGVVGVDLTHHLRKAHVALEIRRRNLQIRALLPRLPDGLPRLDPHALGQIVLRQHDAVARLRVAAHRQRNLSQFGIVHALHAGVKVVQIAV